MTAAPGERRQPSIVFLTTADTEVLATARAVERLPAGFPTVRAWNPARSDIADEPSSTHVEAFLERTLEGAAAVLVRLLGGSRAWPDGFARLRRRCAATGVPLLAFGGEDAVDAELTGASSVPAGVVAQAFEYLRMGGVDNLEQLLRFVADTVLLEGYGFAPPVELPPVGVYHPDGDPVGRLDPGRPTVGVVFYRAHLLAGNTGFVDTLARALEDAGCNALPLYTYSLRPDPDGTVPLLRHLASLDVCLDGLVTTVLAMGGTAAGADTASAPTADTAPAVEAGWDVPALRALDVPVVQALTATGPRARWAASDAGLSPLDTAMQVAVPEFDGRVITVPVSFKETVSDASTVGGPLVRYVADSERAARVAGLASRLARLRHLPNGDKVVAILLSNYPTRHSRIGNAVGLDTPASAVVLLETLAQAGYRVDGAPPDGDALVHALIAAGGHDQAFLTDAQFDAAAGRVDNRRYAAWFARLPAELRAAVVAHWGPPPGDLYLTADRQALVVAGLRFGNVFVGIQPPRGFGENPMAIYHDPDLPPSHHYLAAYWWLAEELRADAVVHLGKHGTLEWLPGKGLGLSAGCAPDAVLGDLPLYYPFVVNDPGEGTQAKRRAHAVIVDHLVPPMMRAETYDDLARLEQLLDEHAQVESLDPAKLPAIRAQVWQLVTGAELHRDLGVEQPPDDFAAFIRHIDGYLCELKDLQIRDGLHVLGTPPHGEQLRGLTKAILRLPDGGRPGLRPAVAAAFGLDERDLAATAGEPATTVPEGLRTAAPGPTATCGDLLDRLEQLTDALLARLDAKGFDVTAVEATVADLVGVPAPELAAVLRFACGEVVPRLQAATRELDALLAGLDGRYVPAGPSGSPTRGCLDVLPTGRNFYSVDPRSLPSQLAWEVGQRLAADLLDRYLAEEGCHPEAVGIVVWGTANMRTHGDDLAEILALLGVRPVWQQETRRVLDVEVIPPAELGRPRIDVIVRISGFFRDAFPHLVELLDRAVALVAGLDEPDELNFVAKHARSDRGALIAAGADRDQAWRRATTRIFGSPPGAYGAGLLPLIDARSWRDDDDMAEVYAVWGGYAYGRGLAGTPARADMERNFRRIRVAVKNQDNREHDLFDSDDYFQYHGGMVATIRALTGANPHAYIGDSADPTRPRTRSLQEETNRVFRARVANPRWIAAMRRHGYKGAFELAATVDYLFGYDATAGVVQDWMYETVSQAYVLDPDTRAFLERSNPWALQAMVERLLEAAQRGLWAEPRAETLQALRAAYLDVDAALEEGPVR